MTATATSQLSSGTWAIDPVHSSINFSVRHLMASKVRGRFEKFGGVTVVAEDGTPSVNAEIAVDSVDTGNDQRDETIKSAEFFDVEKYPVAAFTSTGLDSDGGNYVLNGQFTLKGVTKPISLDLEFYGVNPGMGQGEVAGFEASVVLNRKDFGIDIDLPLETGGRFGRRQGHHHARHRDRQAGVRPQRATTALGTHAEIPTALLARPSVALHELRNGSADLVGAVLQDEMHSTSCSLGSTLAARLGATTGAPPRQQIGTAAPTAAPEPSWMT